MAAQPADHKVSRRFLTPGVIVSGVLLLLLIAASVSFMQGNRQFLDVFLLYSILGIPFVFIGGNIFCIVKRKWLALAVSIFTLPPAWLYSLGGPRDYGLGAVPDSTYQPGVSALIVYGIGAFSLWLFLTLIMLTGEKSEGGCVMAAQPADQKVFRRFLKPGVIVSGVLLLLLMAASVSFMQGNWQFLDVFYWCSMLGIPFVFIGGNIFCIVKRKWLALAVSISTMPPAWLYGLLGMFASLYQPKVSSLVVYGSGAFSLWLFLTLIMLTGERKEKV